VLQEKKRRRLLMIKKARKRKIAQRERDSNILVQSMVSKQDPPILRPMKKGVIGGDI